MRPREAIPIAAAAALVTAAAARADVPPAPDPADPCTILSAGAPCHRLDGRPGRCGEETVAARRGTQTRKACIVNGNAGAVEPTPRPTASSTSAPVPPGPTLQEPSAPAPPSSASAPAPPSSAPAPPAASTCALGRPAAGDRAGAVAAVAAIAALAAARLRARRRP